MRKAGEPFEDFVERQIREAEQAGEFARLPGVGKPIESLDDPPDEMWWLKRKLRDEGLGIVPEELELRRQLEQIFDAHTERELVERLAEVNAKIAWNNAHVISGPPTTLAPLDPALALQRWRSGR